MIESGPTSLKIGRPVYKPAAHLQTGQARNQFATETCHALYEAKAKSPYAV